MDIRQSENYARYLEALGWIVERADGSNVFIKKLPLLRFLSVVKIQRPPASIGLPTILYIVRKYHPILIKFEPDNNSQFAIPRQARDCPEQSRRTIPNSQFHQDNWPLLPTKTIIIDLGGTIWENLPKDTRYEIRKARENKLESRESDDIETFYQILRETMRIGGWSVPLKKEVIAVYRTFSPAHSSILLTYCPADLLPVSGCLLIWEGDTAHYIYAANTARGRRLGAAYLTLFEAINFCRQKRLRYLDLEGIYDERYPQTTKSWRGFTKFKEGWGGKTIKYPGSFVKYFF